MTDLETGWPKSATTEIPRAVRLAIEPSALEREYMLRSVIASQAIEGVSVPYEEASRILDEVLNEPLIEIG